MSVSGFQDFINKDTLPILKCVTSFLFLIENIGHIWQFIWTICKFQDKPKCPVLFMIIWKAELRQKEGEVETKESLICWFTGTVPAMNQEFHLDFPHGWQGSNHLGHLLNSEFRVLTITPWNQGHLLLSQGAGWEIQQAEVIGMPVVCQWYASI